MGGRLSADAEEEFRRYLIVEGYSQETARTYVTSLRAYHSWCDTVALEPTSATRPNIEHFAADQLVAVAKNTVRNRLFAIGAWFRFLNVRGRVGLNPAEGLRVKRPRTAPLRSVPVAEQRRLLFRTSSDRDEAMLLVLIGAGIRVGELVRMKVENIRWAEGMVLIDGKGDKQRAVWLGEETLGQLRGIAGDRTRGPLWLTKDGQPMRRDGARQNFYRLAKRAGVSVHPHQLRATFANNWLESGGDPGSLQVAMGHSDISQTMHYAGASAEARAASISRGLNLAGQVLHDGKVVDFDAARAARQG